MNAPQIHLMLNHVPVLGIVFAAVALGAGLWLRHGTLLRFACFILVAISLAAVPVYFSGEPSEETIEELAGIQESSIERHEDAAGVVTPGLGLLGLISLIVLIRYRSRAIPPRLAASLLVATVVLSGALAWTAHLGGQIRHPEMRADASAATTSAEGESDEHD
jgi:hypothetical protein